MKIRGAPFVWLACAAYAALYFLMGWDRYATYHAGADLGLFVQSISTVFHGFANTTEGGSHFTFHFSPVLYLCAPPLLLTHSPLALIAVQAVAVAATVPALYLIARRRVAEPMAAAIASVALLYPPLAGIAFTDFHENGFAPAAAAWLLWALDGRRFRLAFALALFALAIKEDQAPIVAFVGLAAALYFARLGERRGVGFGIAALGAALTVFAGYFLIVRPLAGATQMWSPVHFYAWTSGDTSHDVAPLFTFGRVTYLLEAFVPLAFLPFRSPVVLLALPGFAEVFLSRESITYTMGQHYAAVWIPYILVAYVLGACSLLRDRRPAGVRFVRGAAIVCCLALAFANPMHWQHFLRARTPHDAALDRMLATLPDRAEVGTHDEIFSHLGFDPKASLGLTRDPELALFDDTYYSSYWVRKVRPELTSAVARGLYRRVRGFDGITLYAKTK